MIVKLETLLADVLEDRFLGAIEEVLGKLEGHDTSWTDFNVREYAENVAVKIMEHVENRAATGMDLINLS